MVWQAQGKPPVKADLAIYINMLGVPGQYKSVALMLGYKLDFSWCADKDGFRRDSHIYRLPEQKQFHETGWAPIWKTT